MTGVVLFLMFTVIPAIETWLLIEIGGRIGGVETVAYLVVMGILGAWLGKRAGFSVLRELLADIQNARPPADRLVEAGLVLVGSVLLVTPGVLTDIVGTLLFVAPFRRFLAPRAKRLILAWLTRRGLKLGNLGPGPAARERQEAEEKAPPRTFSHPEA